MLDLQDHWVWDFWLAEDPDEDRASYHVFFLKAPRSLGDPYLRHVNASVGHARSTDLSTWTRVADAIHPGPPTSYDDLSTWTGCVVRGDDGTWRMFGSGISRAERGLVQRIGVSTSSDLLTWRRTTRPLLEADERWYARQRDDAPQHWRDPWVVRDDRGPWHMYLTAAVPDAVGPGVFGHAVSEDLDGWEIMPPLSEAGRFDQLEVVQVVEVEGRWVALFSCLSPEMPGAPYGAGGIWCVPVEGPGSPVDVAAAVRLTSEDLYAGKVVVRRDGSACLLAFRNRGPDGAFVGGLVDPHRVRWRTDGRGLELLEGPAGWQP